MIGEMVTSVSGSSGYYLGGVVTYSNEAKAALLGVDPELIAAHGAVSEPVAGAMAVAARRRFGADWAVSTTGIAGPTGGSAAKPVGLVWSALAGPAGCETWSRIHHGDREMVRTRAALTALNRLRLAMLRG
jgi:PncC family amidohydrolase